MRTSRIVMWGLVALLATASSAFAQNARQRHAAAEAYDKGRFPEAIALFSELSLAPQFEDFLTLPAYGKL